MKKLLKYILTIFVLLNFLIILSGKSWIYKAISITYFKGYVSSYIHDYIYFPFKKIENGKHQKWEVSNSLNQKKLPNFIKEVNKELETTAFLVIKNDSIMFEKYWHGYSADSMSNSFSMSKSYVATLVGIALNEGKIKSINQPICDFLPEYCNTKESKITIKNLLTMSSGLDWTESYFNPFGQIADAYYGDDLKSSVMNLKQIKLPGKTFEYHSSCTQLLAFILEKATSMTISEYASEKLWKPMGFKHPALWNTDKQDGDEKAFCCINSNARDFARIGKLYMHYGHWNGLQILDSNYVKEATSIADLVDENGNKNVNYGYHFWITKHKGMHIYYARGLWGQYVICIPEINMIIVRLGRNFGDLLEDIHHEDLYLYIDAAFQMYQ